MHPNKPAGQPFLAGPRSRRALGIRQPVAASGHRDARGKRENSAGHERGQRQRR